jgi:hypothetical protein
LKNHWERGKEKRHEKERKNIKHPEE